jgi:hypothetical protein
MVKRIVETSMAGEKGLLAITVNLCYWELWGEHRQKG